MNNPKPCPFCGGPAKAYGLVVGGYYVTCATPGKPRFCGVSQPYTQNSIEDAVEKWNKRQKSPR